MLSVPSRPAAVRRVPTMAAPSDEALPEEQQTFTTLPNELLTGIATSFACTSDVLALAATCGSVRDVLMADTELWEYLAQQALGPLAPSMARAHAQLRRAVTSTRGNIGAAEPPALQGVELFRVALTFRQEVAARLEVLPGSVSSDGVAHDMEVVACPCLPHLQNAGVGAQGAVRRAGGRDLEAALHRLRLPLQPLSATIVNGGANCPWLVAMCVTTPPYDAALSWRMRQHANAGGDSILTHIEVHLSSRLHTSLLRSVRAANCTSLALPTLGTGGMSMSVANVSRGFAHAVIADVQAHPRALLRLRVACFESSHVVAVRKARDHVLEHLFREVPNPECLGGPLHAADALPAETIAVEVT